jgi:hypothetical protein
VRARLYAEAGAQAKALGWIDRAYEEHDAGLSLMKVDPGLDSLRGEGRFVALLDRIGLS